ncbi:HD domain-containing protein [Christensenellaceae bacterium OttesenSCG-928-M15]|nr:HD domain-containing protein [Christensenellaceae bacterium OttesenSCG-928-M15]
MMAKPKKIRDVVYGFVTLDEQEQAIIDHPVFQRLRRIKQLSLTDMLYPGATHTRFEHSIGVMQMASDMFDSIVDKDENKRILAEQLAIGPTLIPVYRKIVRLAALLHDIGHAPFSHSGEEIMPLLPEGHVCQYKGMRYDAANPIKRYKHEEYSITIIKTVFRDVIEKHPLRISADIVTALLDDDSVKKNAATLLWKDLISGQLDADRADYLLRDSRHLGVSYGLYDRDRLVSSMTLAFNEETQAPVIAIQEKGWHLAESLVIARYQMFSQVYFHRVRRIYDHHICYAAKEVLTRSGLPGTYPKPSESEIDQYIDFDDWKINAALKAGLGGKHGDIIMKRQHYKCVDVIHSEESIAQIRSLASAYRQKGIDCYLDEIPSKEWYKLNEDILIQDGATVQPLSEKSMIVNSMKAKPQLTMRLYAERKI